MAVDVPGSGPIKILHFTRQKLRAKHCGMQLFPVRDQCWARPGIDPTHFCGHRPSNAFGSVNWNFHSKWAATGHSTSCLQLQTKFARLTFHFRVLGFVHILGIEERSETRQLRVPLMFPDRVPTKVGRKPMRKVLGLVSALMTGLGGVASADELSLAYFMGPKHPMNKAVFTPFAEKLADVSGGELTVKQFPGGALNSVPPKQYSILLDGVADIIFTLPGYTGEVFPMTNVINLPGLCSDPVSCTAALQRASGMLEAEYNAKVLAIWANAPPILLTKDKPIRTLEDLQGLKLRVTSSGQVPFVKALGASPVGQPVSVINQNLANGVIDAIAIDPSAIGSFKLHEVSNYLTTWFPGSGSAFVLLLNKDVYDGMSDQQRAWIDAAADASLSESGGNGYAAATVRGLEIAKEAGLEFIEIGDEERARWNAIIDETLPGVLAQPAGSVTIGDVFDVMKGS